MFTPAFFCESIHLRISSFVPYPAPAVDIDSSGLQPTFFAFPADAGLHSGKDILDKPKNLAPQSGTLGQINKVPDQMHATILVNHGT